MGRGGGGQGGGEGSGGERREGGGGREVVGTGGVLVGGRDVFGSYVGGVGDTGVGRRRGG